MKEQMNNDKKMEQMNKALKPEMQIRKDGDKYVSICISCKEEVPFNQPLQTFKCPKCGKQNYSGGQMIFMILFMLFILYLLYNIFIL